MTSHAEDEYFAREDAEKKRQLAIAHAKEIASAEKERLKQEAKMTKEFEKIELGSEFDKEVDKRINKKIEWETPK